MTNNTIFCLSFCIILSICFFLYFLFFYPKFLRRTVLSKSVFLSKISDYARGLNFCNLNSEYNFSRPYKSKAKLERINVNNEIITLVYERKIDVIIRQGMQNSNKYDALQSFISTLDLTAPEIIKQYRISSTKFHKQELVLLIDLKQFYFQKIPSFNFRFYYRSPQGKTAYWFDTQKTCAEMYNLLTEYSEIEKKRLLAQNQRNLMNNKLRYQILKRDGFKCSICGRSAKDGVTLHVDHILPVSKGGLTVPDNLRTLCEDCNLGKSDAYDPFGKN